MECVAVHNFTQRLCVGTTILVAELININYIFVILAITNSVEFRRAATIITELHGVR